MPARSKSFRVKNLVEYLLSKETLQELVGSRIYAGKVLHDKPETYILVGLIDENVGYLHKEALVDIRVVGNDTQDSLLDIIDAITDVLITDYDHPLYDLEGFGIYSAREAGGPRTLLDDEKYVIIKDFIIGFLK